MKVLVLGGTGQVGKPVATLLQRRGANVSVLCRSERSEAITEEMGCVPLRGDIIHPAGWFNSLNTFDAVIHIAATFDNDAAQIDARVTEALLDGLSADHQTRRLIYTGGVWLYGATTGATNERSPYNPPRWWQWLAQHAERVMESRQVEGLVIHPANVVDSESGVPPILLREAKAFSRMRLPLPLWGTWPLVHGDDLAQLYALVLAGGRSGEAYIGSSESKVTVLKLAERAAARSGRTEPPIEVPLAEWVNHYGEWASGYGLSQHMDSTKAREELGWLKDDSKTLIDA